MLEFGRIVNINQTMFLILNDITYKLTNHISTLFDEEIPINNQVKISRKFDKAITAQTHKV